MAQWLGVLIGVPEDRGSISGTHMTNDYNSNPVFWPLQVCRYFRVWCTGIHKGETSIHIQF